MPEPGGGELAHMGAHGAAKLIEIVRQMNVLEMMMALGKMRVRRTPANQAHVTNRKENPALLARFLHNRHW